VKFKFGILLRMKQIYKRVNRKFTSSESQFLTFSKQMVVIYSHTFFEKIYCNFLPRNSLEKKFVAFGFVTLFMLKIFTISRICNIFLLVMSQLTTTFIILYQIVRRYNLKPIKLFCQIYLYTGKQKL